MSAALVTAATNESEEEFLRRKRAREHELREAGDTGIQVRDKKIISLVVIRYRASQVVGQYMPRLTNSHLRWAETLLLKHKMGNMFHSGKVSMHYEAERVILNVLPWACGWGQSDGHD